MPEEVVEKNKGGRPSLGVHGKTKKIDVRMEPSLVALIDAAREGTGLERGPYIRQAAEIIARAALRSRKIEDEEK